MRKNKDTSRITIPHSIKLFTKLKNFIYENKIILTGIVIIIISLFVYHYNPFSLQEVQNITISISILIILLWVTEIIPMPVSSLLPIILFPAFELAKIQDICKNYGDPIIFLFMGGFFLAIAIEKWNLHKRIALSILNFCGYQSNQILLGFMLSTAFISMWLSNTATTLMMYPIASSIISVLSLHNSESRLRPFTISLMLSIAYASNIGGLATIIGTPPNTAFVAFVREQFNIQISFFEWFKICGPIALLLLFILYIIFTKILYPAKFENSDEAKNFLKDEQNALGQWTMGEKRVTAIFILMAGAWIFKDLINSISPFQVNDTSIALFGALLLFSISSCTNESIKKISEQTNTFRKSRLLNWDDTNKLSWGILIMFGGGLSLAKQLEACGILKVIGTFLSSNLTDNIYILIIVVACISIFLSEVMSNIAQVIVLSPIICSVSVAMGASPLILGIPMCLAASCAGMLPMGTPPNAIVYASNKIPLKHMIRSGFVLNIISIIVISIIIFLYFRV